MKTEIRYDKFYAEFSKEELENMASIMQKQLQENNNIVSIEFCLETVSAQFGFKYQEIINKFEDMEYQIQKYRLQDEWIKNFMSLNFSGWKTMTCVLEEDNELEESPDFIKYEIFGEDRGIQFDLDTVYDIIWKNLLEIIYLELSLNPIDELKFNHKNDLEKYLLKNESLDNLVINNILHKIHKNMAALPQNIRIQLLDNIAYDYLPELIDNKILYNTKIS